MSKIPHLIKLNRPADKWADGLPLGNGRLGAMPMGKVNDETIVINEETIWYGKERERQNPEGARYWKEIRRLLLEGKVKEAQFGARMVMSAMPKYQNPYQLAGDMRLKFFDHDGEVQQYERVLDVDNAVAAVSYTLNGLRYCREHFVSRKYQVFATKLTCDCPGKLTLSVNMNRRPYEEYTGKIDDKTVYNCGKCGDGGISYFTGITMDADGGSVDTLADFVYCKNADTVYLYTACGTDFRDEDYREKVLSRLEKAREVGYEELKEAHIRDYKSLYDRMELSLSAETVPFLYTDEQLDSLRKGQDDCLLYLTETMFCYGRYLMISSSTDCLLPANLQGIWNGDYQPPWESGYTININEEMNYWMAEKCNLSECHLPLLEQVKRVAKKGRKTAQGLYGCRGFCAHHNIDIWDCTEPGGLYDAALCWPMGGAWLSLHMYDHYLYTQDREFLTREALPLMREAIRFFEDYLY